jgi:hypothetical protein
MFVLALSLEPAAQAAGPAVTFAPPTFVSKNLAGGEPLCQFVRASGSLTKPTRRRSRVEALTESRSRNDAISRSSIFAAPAMAAALRLIWSGLIAPGTSTMAVPA